MIQETFSAAWVEGVFSCGLGPPPAGGVSDAGSVCGVPVPGCDVCDVPGGVCGVRGCGVCGVPGLSAPLV